jgi:hypothetical protein
MFLGPKVQEDSMHDELNFIKEIRDSVAEDSENLYLSEDQQAQFNKKLEQLKAIHKHIEKSQEQKLKNIWNQSWNKNLYEIVSFTYGLEENVYALNYVVTRKPLQLKDVAFKTIAYLYNHNLIGQKMFQDFFSQGNILDISASNMIKTFDINYRLNYYGYKKFFNSKVIPKNWYFSHYRTWFKGEIVIN